MVFGHVVDLVRGGLAWVFGLGVTVLLVVLGVVDESSTVIGTAADAYASAHHFPPLYPLEVPLYLVAVPVVAVALAGYSAGRTLQTGIGGRLRTFVQSRLRSERYRLWQAVVSGAFLAAGYTIVAAVVAFLFEATLVPVVVGSLFLGVVMGIPLAVVGAVS